MCDTRICSECGEDISYRSKAAKTCSKECSRARLDRQNAGDQFIIFNRDGLRCQYCGLSAPEGAKLRCDHIIPHSRGGTDTADNLVTACDRCNGSKHANSLSPESEALIRDTVNQRNKNSGIPPKKGIKGSHCRGQDPRV